MTRIFGHIEGFPEGSHFNSRADLNRTGVHRPTQAGISGSAAEGADSIVLSGGYEDDEDHGNLIIYTGQGGRDANTGNQIMDQTLERGNLALVKSQQEGLPVRVIRGYTHKSSNSPSTGYRYDGLYRVEDHWRERGRSGYYVWRYRLVKDSPSSEQFSELLLDSRLSNRVETTIQRIVRDTRIAKMVKEVYAHRCQVCGIRIEGPAGPYAEAAHIRPLAPPHDGPDRPDNILCLCPNHHVMFDLGSFSIADDYQLLAIEGELRVDTHHLINTAHLAYHREISGFD